MSVNEIGREKDPSILLKDRIVDKIRQNGPLTFAQFMRDSLYDREFGFFSAGRAKFAGARDGESLVTSPEQSPLFGRIIAAHIYHLGMRWEGPKDLMSLRWELELEA